MKSVENFSFTFDQSSGIGWYFGIGIEYISESFIFISYNGMYLWIMKSKFRDINKYNVAIIDGVDEI